MHLEVAAADINSWKKVYKAQYFNPALEWMDVKTTTSYNLTKLWNLYE